MRQTHCIKRVQGTVLQAEPEAVEFPAMPVFFSRRLYHRNKGSRVVGSFNAFTLQSLVEMYQRNGWKAKKLHRSPQ